MPETAAPASPRVSAGGVVLAALFFLASLTPSYMPRDAVMQGALSGLEAALGYLLGNVARLLWAGLELPEGGPRLHRVLLPLACAVAAALIAAGWWLAPGWQDATRAAVGLPPQEVTRYAALGGVAAAVFAGLMAMGLAVGVLFRRLGALARRVMPRRVATVLALLATALAVLFLVNDVVLRFALRVVDESFEAADAFIDPDQPAPVQANRTGSAASLVLWDELGRWGRDYIHRIPTADEIAAATGAPAVEPVRVYVGRRGGETAEERAELAVAELIRQGGFERGTLVVAVPPGTGWMDPGAHDAVEFMLGGDVATVAVQYSYLSSVLALWVHPDYGVEQARALFNAVYAYWTGLPKDRRPRLYVFGLSQGALNSQLTLPILDMLSDPVAGALWVGSPFLSPTWQRVRDQRRAGSPAWRPQYGNGSLIRSLNQQGTGPLPFAPWGPIRLVFLQYGSDAIVNFTLDSAFRVPAALRPPRAPDVSPQLRWIPVVTMLQTALDTAISLSVPGHGHFYVSDDYADAWAMLLDPPGWTPARAARIKAALRARTGG